MRSALGKAVRKGLSRRLAAIAPEFVERPAAEMQGMNGRLYAWRAGDALTCFIQLHIDERDAFTFNVAWGPTASFPLAGSDAASDADDVTVASANVCVGWLSAQPHEVWWALYALPDLADGDWLERTLHPPPVEELLPKVESLLEKAVARLADEVLPLFARVARARGLPAPARWEAPPPRVMVAETEAARAREVATVPKFEDLPRVIVPDGFVGPIDAVLGPSLAHLDAIYTNIAPSPVRETLEIVLPRYRELVAAASAIMVPLQQEVDARLTPSQRRMVEGFELGRPIYEPGLYAGGGPGVERRAVFWAQLISSCLRLVAAPTGVMSAFVAAAENYERAIERVVPRPAPKRGLVLP